jgi:hypothetical protein
MTPSSIGHRRVVGASVLTALAVTLAMYACTVPTTNYGNPNGLDRRSIPGEGGVEELACTGDASVSGEGGGAGGCAVSFSKDIYPLFAATGEWQCSSADCHGAGKQDPALDGKTASEMYTQLQAVIVANLPYLPSAPDAGLNKISMLCNLRGECGTKMPRPPGKDPTDSELCLVSAWLSCGAPNN